MEREAVMGGREKKKMSEMAQESQSSAVLKQKQGLIKFGDGCLLKFQGEGEFCR